MFLDYCEAVTSFCSWSDYVFILNGKWEITEPTRSEADWPRPDMGRPEGGNQHCVQETEHGQSPIHETLYSCL